MNWLSKALQQWAQHQPEQIALCGGSISLSYAQTYNQVESLGNWLSALPGERIGLLLDNSPAWALLDIACMDAGKTMIPIPAFFSESQIVGLLADADIDLVLTDLPGRITELGEQPVWAAGETLRLTGRLISCLHPDHPKPASASPTGMPANTAKITYTSGSTGNPKGVCLSSESLHRVATELTAAMKIDSSYQHLCLLPLAVLLENVAGLYVALLGGASCRLEPLQSLGWRGMTDFDFCALASVMQAHRVDSLILVPELLTGLLALAQQKPDSVTNLRLVAVGGAAVAPGKLALADQLGLPVFQGYGLSECGSVVAVNSPRQNRLGSVGKPLPHQRLKIGDDGQIWIAAQGVSSYLGRAPVAGGDYWPTGDRGYLDDDGYLFIEGRIDNLLMTSFGRNVSPEWVEILLIDQSVIQQAVLVGGGQRQLEALLVVAEESADEPVERALAEVNQQLPDYAQVSRWRRTGQRLTVANGLLMPGGLPDRAAVSECYRHLSIPVM